MKNGGKNKSVVFIILVSVCIYIYIYYSTFLTSNVSQTVCYGSLAINIDHTLLQKRVVTLLILKMYFPIEHNLVNNLND